MRSVRAWVRVGLLAMCFSMVVLFLAVGSFFAAHLWKAMTGPPYGSDGPHSGWTAVWVGDVDGDEVPDIALKTVFEKAGNDWGVIRVLSGATGRTLRVLGSINISQHLDETIGPVEDLNRDGREGIWWKSRASSLHIVASLNSTATKSLRVGVGETVAVLGDVDGDNQSDLLVGGYPLAGESPGIISAVSTRSWTAIWTLSKPTSKEKIAPWFASHACVAGDVNSDGIADTAIVDEEERILLVDGSTGSIERKLDWRVDNITGILAPLGDVDGDGSPELIVYEEWSRFGRRRSGPAKTPLRIVACSDGSLLRGLEVPGMLRNAFSPGDVDGDGVPDVAWNGEGRLGVVRGSDGAMLWSADGVWAYRGVGDYDHDGRGDLLVSRNIQFEPGEDAPEDLWRMGRIEVLSGRDGFILRTFDESVLSAQGG